jgi:hypothetical protein
MKTTKNKVPVGVLYVRSETGVRAYSVDPGADRVGLEDSSFVLLSDVVQLDQRLFYLAATDEAFREWSTFSKSLRSVTLSSLFDDAGDISSTIKNVVFGGVLILVFVVLLQVNGVRGNLSSISAQLTQIQGQVSQPVELRIPRQ